MFWSALFSILVCYSYSFSVCSTYYLHISLPCTLFSDKSCLPTSYHMSYVIHFNRSLHLCSTLQIFSNLILSFYFLFFSNAILLQLYRSKPKDKGSVSQLWNQPRPIERKYLHADCAYVHASEVPVTLSTPFLSSHKCVTLFFYSPSTPTPSFVLSTTHILAFCDVDWYKWLYQMDSVSQPHLFSAPPALLCFTLLHSAFFFLSSHILHNFLPFSSFLSPSLLFHTSNSLLFTPSFPAISSLLPSYPLSSSFPPISHLFPFFSRLFY